MRVTALWEVAPLGFTTNFHLNVFKSASYEIRSYTYTKKPHEEIERLIMKKIRCFVLSLDDFYIFFPSESQHLRGFRRVCIEFTLRKVSCALRNYNGNVLYRRKYSRRRDDADNVRNYRHSCCYKFTMTTSYTGRNFEVSLCVVSGQYANTNGKRCTP